MSAKGDGLDPIRECLAGFQERGAGLRSSAALDTLNAAPSAKFRINGKAGVWEHAAELLAAAIERAEGEAHPNDWAEIEAEIRRQGLDPDAVVKSAAESLREWSELSPEDRKERWEFPPLAEREKEPQDPKLRYFCDGSYVSILTEIS